MPAGHVRARLVHHAGHRRRHQRRVEVLTLAGRIPVVERREDRDRGVQAGDHVERRDARAVGRARGVAGEGHEAGHRLHHEVITRQVLAAAAAEPADRRVDDRRVHRADRVVVKAEAGKPAGLEVLHEHVRPAGELLRERAVAVVLQVERDGPLVPVDRQEVGRHAVLGDRRHPGARVVTAGRLHLDHVRAEVGEQHRAVRPGQDAGKVRDEQPGQRTWPRGFAHLLVPLMRALLSGRRCRRQS